ncbi:IS110 family transposase [Methanophagales archaeon]|nr:MAG: IS110 family transposase [Methanophagales archaeon]RJS79095.1 MAG: IS110 family transposase [Methanophagales archaeon]
MDTGNSAGLYREIGRFKRPESLVCYAGLAPKVEQSGEHMRYGHINKHSNGFLRWTFIQSAANVNDRVLRDIPHFKAHSIPHSLPHRQQCLF